MAFEASVASIRRGEQTALVLVAAGAAYNLVEGVLSVAAGIQASSIALIGFGSDSAIEVTASLVVLVHLVKRNGAQESALEQRVATYVGLTFIALAAFVALKAIADLITQSRPDESYLGIGIACASLVFMPLLARWKHRLAHHINSRALEAESRETLVCSYLSVALLLGLGANALFGWWWADPVSGLIIVAVIAKEGWEAFTRKELCCLD